ncbi:MAG: Crp/Fnr family transcriptional regulator [Pyrinomonadaceae bacterium]
MVGNNNSVSRGNSILDLLPEIERREIFSLGKVICVAAEETIYHFGDPITHLYFPLNSAFSATSLMEDGSSAEVSLTGHEGVIGFFAAFNEQQSARYWISVLTSGEAVKVELANIRHLFAESKKLQSALLASSRNLMCQISQRAVCNGSHSLAERFCFWLLLVHDRAKTDEIVLTHEVIARKLGARRAGITNIAGMLQIAKVIAYNRGTIRIINRWGLEKESCECYAAVQNALAAKE